MFSSLTRMSPLIAHSTPLHDSSPSETVHAHAPPGSPDTYNSSRALVTCHFYRETAKTPRPFTERGTVLPCACLSNYPDAEDTHTVDSAPQALIVPTRQELGEHCESVY